MKDNDINQLIDRLQGFDGDTLRDEMTDGLEPWCSRRRKRAVAGKRVLVLAMLLLTSTAIAMTVVPLLHTAPSAEEHTGREARKEAPASRQPATDAPETPHAVLPLAEELPVEYHYTGVAEDGYSVAYGHDTRTLTYTRYSGAHLISSVVHDAPDDWRLESKEPEAESAAPLPAVRSTIACDFQTVSPVGDALYYTVTDSVLRTVSVRGDVAEWMGQRVCYSDSLLLPATVEHEGVVYTVTSVADSAFAGHDELRAVVLPSTVERLGDLAFAECRGLERLVVLASVPPVAAPATFDRTDARLLLTVPCGCREAYEDDVEWLYFRNVTEDCFGLPDPRRPVIRVIRR